MLPREREIFFEMVSAISFFLCLFCPCNNHANKTYHNSKTCASKYHANKTYHNSNHTYAKTVPIKFVITPKRLYHATESDHVKYRGVAKSSESILKGFTGSMRSVQNARAMIAYLDSLEDVTELLRAPYKIRHPISNNHAKLILHNLGSHVCNNHAKLILHNLIARFRKPPFYGAELGCRLGRDRFFTRSFFVLKKIK